MTTDELLDDLDNRLKVGVDNLHDLLSQQTSDSERTRLRGKASGLALVRDWLRSYR